jgi:drug/metabolite transporter (DMT)-like permease
VVIALAGGFVVVGADLGSGGGSLAGDLLALATAVTMAVYFTIGGQVRKRMAGDLYILILFSSCWACFAAGMLLTKTPVTGYPVSDYLWLLLMTALCQLGAHAVLNWSMAHVSALYVSAWGTAEIVSAPILAFLVLGEVPGVLTAVGGLIVIGGLLYYNYHEPHTPPS